MDLINERVNALRKIMKEHNISAYIIPSTDPHSGEYVPSRWASREWISGFTGSAGTAVVTMNEAALWTDSRYFIQAAKQLEGTCFELMKDKLEETPSITDWLASKLTKGDVVGVDGTVNTMASVDDTRNKLALYGIDINSDFDLIDKVWDDRPSVPQSKAIIHPMEYAGEEAKSKISRIRNEIRKNGANAIIISALDDIAWTLNLRGDDIHCTPVVVSYLLITDKSATLYINKEKLTAEVSQYLSQEGVATDDYGKIFSDLATLEGMNIQINPSGTNSALRDAIKTKNTLILKDAPTAMMKSIKNETEIKAYQEAMILDGVALVKFLMWLKPAVEKGNETEMSIEQKLRQLRMEQPTCKGISFDTIDGYKEHGAIVHYEVTEETDIPVRPEGMILIDSGGHFGGGTTDITRTVALGPTTEEERHDYTLVLKGNIQLSQVTFPEGSSGTQLDVLARSFMWAEKLNYLHGTGHGVGAYLSVHEGPHQFRMNWMPAPLLPGMTITNEPGLYKEGKHGVRTENVMLIVPAGEGMFSRFCKFEILTLCPIDTTPIDWSIMTEDEVEWLNNYHKTVYEKLSPRLNNEEKEWLKQATKKIEL